MLVRHFLGYLPANVIPAITGFVSVYVYTRMLNPAEFGIYSLVNSVATLCQAAFFYWLQLAAMRFHARAEIDGNMSTFAGSIYRGALLSSTLLSILYATVLSLGMVNKDLLVGFWIGLPLVLVRSILSISQAFNRGGQRIVRYNLIECSQPVLALFFGVLILTARGDGAHSVLFGLVAGGLVGCAIDIGAIVRGIRSPTDIRLLRTLVLFGGPLVVCNTLGYLLNTADRLVIQYLLGSSEVGTYSVAYNIIDRSIGGIFIAISTAAFPLTARVLETHGVSAASKQMTQYATLLLSIGLPACAGLIAAGPQIGAVLIGPAFRDEALQIMPWLVLSVLMSGLQIHYFDQAFVLGKRTKMLVWFVGPAALLNVALNFTLLPRMALKGAVLSTLVAHAVALAASIVLGRRVLKIGFPFGSALRIALASVFMAAAVRCLDLPPTWTGLTGTTVVGVMVYAGACFALDVAGLRAFVYQRFLERGRKGPEPAEGIRVQPFADLRRNEDSNEQRGS